MPWGQGGPSGSVLEKKQNSGVRGEGRKESPLCLSDLLCRKEEPVSYEKSKVTVPFCASGEP